MPWDGMGWDGMVPQGTGGARHPTHLHGGRSHERANEGPASTTGFLLGMPGGLAGASGDTDAPLRETICTFVEVISNIGEDQTRFA